MNKGVKLLPDMFKAICSGGKSYDSWIQLNFLSGGDGQCTAEMRVAEEHLNRMGTMHGGCTASLVDIVSTLALMTLQRSVPGVSVDLNVSYMKAAKLGEDILIDARTLKAGKMLAFLDVVIKNKADGSVIATGKHTKFIGQGLPDPGTEMPKNHL